MDNFTKPGDRMLACFGMPELHPREQIVLAIIAFHDGAGGAWPSLRTIADKAGISRSWTSEIVGEVERKGRLRRRKAQRTNVYHVCYCTPFCCQEDLDGRNRLCCQEDPTPAVRVVLTGTGSEPGQDTEQRIEGWDEPRIRVPIGWDWGWCPECKIRRGNDYKFPEGSDTCLVCGLVRDLPDERRCRSPDLCHGIMDERGRCRVCGADQ